MGLNLLDNVQGILDGRTAIEQVKDENLQKEPFYGAVMNKDWLEKAYSKLQYHRDFSTLEKMMLLALDDIVKTYSEHLDDKGGIIFSSTKKNIEALTQTNKEAYFF